MFNRVTNNRDASNGNRSVCKFWLEGRCKFGDNCRFSHPPRDSLAGGGGDKKLPYGLNREYIKADLTGGDEKPSWPLSAYGPGRDAPRQLLEGAIEQSPEEVRVQFYLAQAQGNTAAYEQTEREALQAANVQCQKILSDLDGAMQYVINGKDAHPNREDMLVKPSTAWEVVRRLQDSGGHSNATFGAQPPTGPSTFGQPSQPSAFGAASTFGKPSTATPAFGQPSQPTTQPSPFGQPSTLGGGGGSAFGKPSPSGGGSAFGQPSALGSGSSFGQPSAPGSGSAFGQPSALGAPSAFGRPSNLGAGSPFGQRASDTGGTAFGQPSQPASTSAFGQPSALGNAAPNASAAFGRPSPLGSQTQTSNPAFGQSTFGTQPSGSSAFGQPSQPSVASAFGQPSQPSAFGKPSPFANTAGTTSAFGQPSSLGAQSAFGQPSQPAFGQTSQPTAPPAFGQPSQPATKPAFGQPSQPTSQSAFGQPSPFAPSSSSTTAAPAPASAFTQPSSSSSISPPAPQSSSPFPSTSTPSTSTPHPSFSNYPLTKDEKGHTFYANPRNAHKPERVWFPDGGPPPTNPDTEAAAPEETYAGVLGQALQQAYKYVRETGGFENGVVPEVPPRREWVRWDI